MRDGLSHGIVRSGELFLIRMLVLYFAFVQFMPAIAAQQDSGHPPIASNALKRLSLEELSQIEVTTPSKEPVKAFQTAAAIYVITGRISSDRELPIYRRLCGWRLA